MAEKRSPNPIQTPGDDGTWADHVFNVNGAPGIRREWWHHGPSGIWFILERDTRTDTVVRIVDREEATGA